MAPDNTPDHAATPASRAALPGTSGNPDRNRPQPMELSPSALAARLVRQAFKAALGTLDRTTGHPYASLVTVATEPDGSPVLLISGLALHTRNLQADQRASLMIDGTAPDGDPLAGGRVTLMGRCMPSESATAPGRFISRHPTAAVYAGFADFRFYRFDVERAHFIGGFGRIVDLEPVAIVTSSARSETLAAAEAMIVAKVNAEFAISLRRIADAHGGATVGNWRVSGLDGEGIDLVGTAAALRVPFAQPVASAEAAWQAIERLAREAGQDKMQV